MLPGEASIAVLRFNQDIEPPTACADGFVRGLLLSNHEQAACCDAAFGAIRAGAIDATKSRNDSQPAFKEFTRA